LPGPEDGLSNHIDNVLDQMRRDVTAWPSAHRKIFEETIGSSGKRWWKSRSPRSNSTSRIRSWPRPSSRPWSPGNATRSSSTSLRRTAQRLHEVLGRCRGRSAATIADAIEESLTRYGPQAARDDFAILVLRVKPSEPAPAPRDAG